MKLIDKIGVLGAWLYLVKIIIHGYIKSQSDEKSWASGANLIDSEIIFFPVFKELENGRKSLRLFCNVIYWISVAFMALYLVAINCASPKL